MTRTRWLDLTALAALVALTASLRAGTFGLIHDRGDQLIWAAIARNVSARGLEGYTVRGIDTRWEVIPERDDVALVRAELAPLVSGSAGNGNLVRGLAASGESYWDAPLANQPPGFTALLVLAHGLCGRDDDGFPLLGRSPLYARVRPNAGEEEHALALRVAEHPPDGSVRAQLWATLLPFASDLATVVLLWVAGVRLLRSRRAALVLGLAYATDPLALYAAHRVLSNATLATVSLGTVLAWHEAERSRGRERLLWLWLAGTLAACAIAVKASAIFLLPAAIVARWSSERR